MLTSLYNEEPSIKGITEVSKVKTEMITASTRPGRESERRGVELKQDHSQYL